jgi:capsular exopolysaccharide synthesis family protein
MSRLEEALNKAAMSAGADRSVDGQVDADAASAMPDVETPPPAHTWEFDTLEVPRAEPVAIAEPVAMTDPVAMTEPVTMAEPVAMAEPPMNAPEVPKATGTWDLPSAMESFQFGELASGKTTVGPEAESCLVEQYRRLAASLHHAQIQRNVRTVMVTSAVASEGKTLTATNLALTLSQSYKRRVLLIDADLRRPTVHEVFRTTNTVGLGDVLRNPDVRRLPLLRMSPTLWILTAGRPDSDPMSGLVSEEMKLLLTEASDHFDWVIVDTPPVALLSDANLLSSMIDVSILVVGAGSTPFPLVRRAVESVGAERILGIVLNKIDRAQMVGGYGYYDYYGYKTDLGHPAHAPVTVAQPSV